MVLGSHTTMLTCAQILCCQTSSPGETVNMSDNASGVTGDYSLLGKVEGAEKAFLEGRRNRGADLESAVEFFLEFLRDFESFDFAQPCVTVFGSTPSCAIPCWAKAFSARKTRSSSTGPTLPPRPSKSSKAALLA